MAILVAGRLAHQRYPFAEHHPLHFGFENLGDLMSMRDWRHSLISGVEGRELEIMGYDAKLCKDDARNLTKACRCAQTRILLVTTPSIDYVQLPEVAYAQP